MNHRPSFLIAASIAALCLQPAQAQVRIDMPPLVSGFAPAIRITGLAPHAKARVHLFRMFSIWESDDPTKRTGWHQVPMPLQSWADVRANARGTIDLAGYAVTSGTYRGTDAYGLLWSGRKPKDKLLVGATVAGFDPGTLHSGESLFIVTQGSTVLAKMPLRTGEVPGLRVLMVKEGRLNGAYAAPADGKRHPVVILLHGSEGGDLTAAREIAERFARQGFAAFALNYFAWDLKQIPGVPNAHVNQPIELLTRVRDWVAQQPEADGRRVGVYGHSKGAEYATVAAVYLRWIRAVAACVPSDSVWEGYGIGDARNRAEPGRVAPAQLSSWSWMGRPLPYIALPPKDDRSGYIDNTAYYEARRAADPAAAMAARIPIERSSAHFLWLGGGRDETWASGAMATRNDLTLRRAGKASRSELHVYPRSSHAICGDGTYPTHLWVDQSTDPRRPDLDADGRATVYAWQRIVAFFRRVLR